MDRSNKFSDSESNEGSAMIPPDTFKKAVTIVRSELSEDTAKILRYSFENGEPDKVQLHQAGFGVAIRNLLAKRGIVWEDVIMYSVWFAILQKALEIFLDS